MCYGSYGTVLSLVPESVQTTWGQGHLDPNLVTRRIQRTEQPFVTKHSANSQDVETSFLLTPHA